MSYVVLARKWRPQTFEDVIGQEHVVRTIHNAIETGRVAHAFLFTGARGVGKTTAARLLAKSLCCQDGGPRPEPCNTCSACTEITSGNSVDVLEIDGASNTGVDDVRELRESARYLPQRMRLKIFIIDEVHMLSVNAFNALLKLLEEPPPHLKFIFATTEPHKIPITILSRCQRYDFKRIPNGIMTKRLESICAKEGITVEREAYDVVCRAAEGGMRDALSLLDQVLSFVGPGKPITASACVDALGVIDRRTIVALVDAIVARDGNGALTRVREASDRGYDLKELGGRILEELRGLAVVQLVKDPKELFDLPESELAALKTRAAATTPEHVQHLFTALALRLETLGKTTDPLLGMEMAVLSACLAPPAVALQEVADLVARLEAAAGGVPLAPVTPKAPGGAGGSGPSTGPAPTPAPPPAAIPAPSSAAAVIPKAAPTTVPGADPLLVRILAHLQGDRPALVSFLDVARVRVDADRLVIQCLQQFYFDAFREAANERALTEATRAVLGPAAVVEVHPPGGDAVAGHSLAEMRDEERAARDAQRASEARENPAIKLAVEIFAGKIREVRAIDGA